VHVAPPSENGQVALPAVSEAQLARLDHVERISALHFTSEQEEAILFGVELSEILFYNFWEGVGEASGFYKAQKKLLPLRLSDTAGCA
jgi:hypothetical protein